MPASKPWRSLSPAWARALRIGVCAILGIAGIFLILFCVHRGFLPIIAWFFPQLEVFFYDLAVFGAYRTQNYVSFDLTSPRGVAAQWSDQCDDGYLFFGPNGKSVESPGPVILDSQGGLIWMSDEYDVATNVQVQRYKGQDFLTFWAGHKKGSLGQGATFMLDSKYKVAHQVHTVGESLKADLHEFAITDDGTALITIYNTTTMDLRPMGWGRSKDGWVEDCIFQEVNIATGELLFQWRAQDHYKAEESYYWHPFAGYVESIPFDFFHMNSIEKDSKGNFLISSRHFHTVTYINGTTGETIWILGGGEQSNQFTDLSDGLATGFQWQHHARWISEDEGVLSIMDNGVAGPLHVDAPYSKGILIGLDQEKLTATHLQSYISLEKAKAASQGSVQLLPNGHLLVGWGSSAAYSEFDIDGTLLCETHFAASWSFWWERVKNYRVFKHHGWVGMPDYPPSAKIKDDALYVSWNGATEVKFWELQGPRSSNTKQNSNDFESIDVIEKRNFEEKFLLPQESDYTRYRAVALDSEKQVLHYSDPVQPETAYGSTIGVLLGICAGVALAGGRWLVSTTRLDAAAADDRELFGWDAALFSRESYQYSKL